MAAVSVLGVPGGAGGRLAPAWPGHPVTDPSQNAEQAGHPVVVVGCRLGHRRAVHPGEVGPHGVALCGECKDRLRVMVPESAYTCFCGRA